MESANSSYCRLCAESKPTSKLLDLRVNDGKRDELTAKLRRVNAVTDFTHETLPKTVCYVCVDKLDCAFEFVEIIHQAQGVLSDIFLVQRIKEDHGAISSDDDNFSYEPVHIDHEYSFKVENISVKEETDELAESPQEVRMKSKVESPKKKLKDSTSSGLDDIPLSQLNLSWKSWKDYNWTCAYCQTQFPTIDELTDHSMQYHNTCNAFRCTDCNVRKLRLDSFLTHVRKHNKHLKLSCYKCDKGFSSSYITNEHVKEHKNTVHVCSGCNSTFATADELNNHTIIYYHTHTARPLLIGTDIDEITNDLTCLICEKTFSCKKSLNTHLLTHTERKRNHTCDKCGKCFLSKPQLEAHIVLHDNPRPYPCQICKAAFKTLRQLSEHVGVHDNKKPFACNQCGRCFRLKRQLTSHSIIHTDALPYVCSYCSKGFRFRNLLNQHIRQHTGVKPYSCSVCQREFTNWPNYNKHMKGIHGINMAKKKHTPDGVYSKDPRTGVMIVPEETNNLVEWKNQLMLSRKRQPRRLLKTQALQSELNTNDTNSGVDNLSLTE